MEIRNGINVKVKRWAIVAAILLPIGVFVKYPSVISVPVRLTGSVPPAAVIARTEGKISQVRVKNHQEVKCGDYLAVINNPAKTDDVLSLKRFLENLAIPPANPRDTTVCLPDSNLQVGALQPFFSTFYTALFEYAECRRLLYFPRKITITREQIAQYEEEYAQLLSRQRIIKERFLRAQKNHRRDSLLFVERALPAREMEISENAYRQILLAREQMRANLDSLKLRISQMKEALVDTKQQDAERTAALQTQLQARVSQLQTEIGKWETAYVLLSPADGKVLFADKRVENRNVSPDEKIFTVVPVSQSRIIGQAVLPAARARRVKTGMRVNIRVQNFPEKEYGILRGTVSNMTPLTGNRDSCVVEINLPDQLTTTYNKELPFLPNMQGRGKIVRGKLSLLGRLRLNVRESAKK
ncbi:MAG: HlyD family secretion protein [Dysgonamonadaceae bacterium]|jgi:HlyD family secretion protein|nr:HlyD family secretion protein [Dysgonamonadaceae bacterium]